MSDTPTLAHHPLAEMMSAAEFAQLRKDVELGRVSWPVGVEIRREEEA